MKVWKVININADDRLLEDVLNYDMERKGRVVKEIIFLENYGQFKIIYTEEDTVEEAKMKMKELKEARKC
jgi:hypothetical protein